MSWLGRIGCSDFDQDGWVDWNSQYPYGDIFSDNQQHSILMAIPTETTTARIAVILGMTPTPHQATHFLLIQSNTQTLMEMDTETTLQILSVATLVNLITEPRILTAWVVRTQMVMALQTQLTSGMNL